MRQIIQSADSSLINALAEACSNILRGALRLSASKLRKLKKFKKQLRVLAKKSSSLKVKRKNLQVGGFASLIASTIAPLILSGVSKLVSYIKKKKNKKKKKNNEVRNG